jgi:hypothetical protein
MFPDIGTCPLESKITPVESHWLKANTKCQDHLPFWKASSQGHLYDGILDTEAAALQFMVEIKEKMKNWFPGTLGGRIGRTLELIVWNASE